MTKSLLHHYPANDLEMSSLLFGVLLTEFLILCRTNVLHISLKKRRTRFGHKCSECYQSYSRGWVLKRHLREKHHIQTLGDTFGQVNSNKLAFPKGFETLIQMELLTEIRNLNSKLSGGESGSQSKKAIRLALDAIKPIYAGTQVCHSKSAKLYSKNDGGLPSCSKVSNFGLLVLSLPTLFCFGVPCSN